MHEHRSEVAHLNEGYNKAVTHDSCSWQFEGGMSWTRRGDRRLESEDGSGGGRDGPDRSCSLEGPVVVSAEEASFLRCCGSDRICDL